MLKAISTFLALTTAVAALTAAEARLLRFPDVSRDSVAFVYAGDLWIAPLDPSGQAAQARQLTADPGLEWFPKFSPDGKWIAFTGEYDGNRDVYVMPATGGEPRRLTWWTDAGAPSERMGPNNEVIDWTPDGKSILFRSRHQSMDSWVGRLYTVSVDGGSPKPLPMTEGGLASYSPDGKKVAYNRIFRDFRTWKRYRGGMTQDIWIYDLDANTAERLTDNETTHHFPMWIGDKVYYAGDRDNTENLFSIDVRSKQVRKHTSFTDFDVKWPSLGPDRIVFENGGYLYLLELATEKLTKLAIEADSDRRWSRSEFVDASENITGFALSPDAKRALFAARGDIFTVPAEKGNSRNLTNSSGSRERGGVWSPDAKYVAYVSDASGEDEIYIVAQDGKAPAQRLTSDGHCYRFNPVWSPDSKKIAFADKDLKLWYLDVATKTQTQVDKAEAWEITQYAWSPDSQWLAYRKPSRNQFGSIMLYSLAQKKIFAVTSDATDSSEPVFDPEGRYLYFLSNRDFNAILAPWEGNYLYTKMTRPYAVTLQADAPSPFEPQSDEAKAAPETPAKTSKDGKDGAAESKQHAKKEEPVKPMKIDTSAIESRVVPFPVEPGNYFGLTAAADRLVFMEGQDNYLTGGPKGPSVSLHLFDMDKRKDAVLLTGIDNYDLAAGGEKLIYKSEKKYGIVDAKVGTTAKVGDGALSLAGMQVKLDRRAEFRQMFDDAWRQERDFFYAANMHGYDWKALHDRYAQLLPYVSHRSDLSYLIGEMIAELNCSHSYVGGGDAPKPKKVSIGNLGIDWELDAASGRYRIARILEGQSWIPSRRSPLIDPGLNIAPGSYVLAIDGQDLRAPAVPESLLENAAGRTVTLRVNTRPATESARDVVVTPLDNEGDLRYVDWVLANRRKVDQATGGRVGYIHIPDMGGDGLNEFARTFYAQIRKEGLIVDVRYNGGGFVSEMIIERLRRVLAGMGTARNAAETTYPASVFTGPMVCLINQYSASDGDIFPYYFKKYGLGPLIGMRTWGGVVGIRGYSPLVDGGYVTRPEFGNYDLEGKWNIENHGVDPDIEVDNRPDLVARGQDPQLEKAIAVVLEKMKEKPAALPPRPPDPVK
ncbi:MAG: S41 family peptidase [Acidobacteriota bacterium]